MSETSLRRLRTNNGKEYELPLFMPVYQSNLGMVDLESARVSCSFEACIINAFFLYKNRELRQRFKDGLTLREHIQFPDLIMTDSGAFQGFARPLLLSNTSIIKFQEQIGADIASPLDLVTPPGNSRRIAEKKMHATLKRIEEGQRHVSRTVLAGVQQGGRFPDLRRENMERLMELGCRYIALGSLVPFFTKNHDLTFVGKVIKDARAIAGPDVPIHVYGAGDPVELPLMVAMGADIFDSSSYAHYARRSQYMTPFGALTDIGALASGEFVCGCELCRQAESPLSVCQNVNALAAHNLWTICMTIRKAKERLLTGQLNRSIDETLLVHQRWFPDSRLAASWSELNGS